MPRTGTRIKGNAEERARARDELRASLVSAARELADEKGGYDNVTVRRVADRVGYTVPVVYEYFSGKQDLLVGVLTAGFDELAGSLDDAGRPEHATAAGGALRSVARAVWHFAHRNPYLYQLMHSLRDVPFGSATTPEPARRCFQLLSAAVAAREGDHPAGVVDADAPTDLFWAQIHGLITLSMNGRIRGGKRRARTLLDHAADTFAQQRGTVDGRRRTSGGDPSDV